MSKSWSGNFFEDFAVGQEIRHPTPRTLTFNTYDLPITVPAIDQFRRRGTDYNELFFNELFELGYGGAEKNLTRLAIGLDRSEFEPFVCTIAPLPERRRSLVVALWERVSSPQLRPFVRLFFETVAATAGAGDPHLDDRRAAAARRECAGTKPHPHVPECVPSPPSVSLLPVQPRAAPGGRP